MSLIICHTFHDNFFASELFTTCRSPGFIFANSELELDSNQLRPSIKQSLHSTFSKARRVRQMLSLNRGMMREAWDFTQWDNDEIEAKCFCEWFQEEHFFKIVHRYSFHRYYYQIFCLRTWIDFFLSLKAATNISKINAIQVSINGFFSLSIHESLDNECNYRDNVFICYSRYLS